MIPFLSATALTALVFLACLGFGQGYSAGDGRLVAFLAGLFLTLPPLAMGCLALVVTWLL